MSKKITFARIFDLSLQIIISGRNDRKQRGKATGELEGVEEEEGSQSFKVREPNEGYAPLPQA